MKTLMERIDRLSGKLKAVEDALSDPALYADSDHPDLQQLLRNQLGLTEEIAEKEAEWLELSSQVESLTGSKWFLWRSTGMGKRFATPQPSLHYTPRFADTIEDRLCALTQPHDHDD